MYSQYTLEDNMPGGSYTSSYDPLNEQSVVIDDQTGEVTIRSVVSTDSEERGLVSRTTNVFVDNGVVYMKTDLRADPDSDRVHELGERFVPGTPQMLIGVSPAELLEYAQTIVGDNSGLDRTEAQDLQKHIREGFQGLSR